MSFHTGHHASPASAVVKDPGCGMDVDPATSEYRFEHDGQTYFFCSGHCQAKFAATPRSYLGPTVGPLVKDHQHAGSAPVVDEVAEWTCPMHPEIRQPGPGSCSICGMALEPVTVTADSGPSLELAHMTRRFWVAVVLSIPVLILGMGRDLVPAIHDLLSATVSTWTQLENSECGHEWQQTPGERDQGQRLRCPECRTILDSLAYHFPEVADEWSRDNPVSAWQVRPSGQTAFTPVWVCATNPEHVWTASLTSRSSGSGCPECRDTGKSRVELDHHAAAERIFGRAASGQAVAHEAFARRARWVVDITTVSAAGAPVAIEYDGSYWHADKSGIDTEKSLDLLAAGYAVVRLREHPLPSLPINDALPRDRRLRKRTEPRSRHRPGLGLD